MYSLFQCSSASRKFLNTPLWTAAESWSHRFSALQRAENSSIFVSVEIVQLDDDPFQCSSASRKFLNYRTIRHPKISVKVSVLFSEPKIPQLFRALRPAKFCLSFSALQRAENSSIRLHLEPVRTGLHRFSALQRAENSSIAQILALVGER